MKIALTTLGLMFVVYAHAQIDYIGFIDKYPVELITDKYSDDDIQAIYQYNNVHIPISLHGSIKNNVLAFEEKDKNGLKTAEIVFTNFNTGNNTLNGTWTDFKTKKVLNIKFDKVFDVDNYGKLAWKNKDLIQSVYLKDKYFKVILSKETGEAAKITGVKIIDRVSNKLIQQININCELRGFNSISIGDFNFDGYEDFSVFEASYAGANTSSLYFLFNPKTNQFFDSHFEGVSLEFDEKSKTVSETNQCCAGTQSTTAQYQVIKNKLVLIDEHCYIWDEKKQDFSERPMKDCQ